MYRLVALARAVDERMWILNRAGRIPFVISGQGHEGAQVGIAWAFEQRPRLDRPVLPLDRDVPDVRDERARHHDRPVRDRHRPVVGRAPDARPLRLATSTTSCRSRRRSRRSCSTRSGIALAAKIRKTGQVAMASMGEGSSQPGRRPRGPQLRGDPQAAVRLRRREQRLRHQRAGGDGGLGRRTSPTGRRATGSRASSSTASDVLACYAAARDAVARARAGEGPTLIEAKVTRLTGALVGRPADEVPLRGGARRGARATTRCRAFRDAAPRRRRPDRRDRGAR